MSSQAALKIAFNGEIHRSRVDLNVFQRTDLLRLVAQTFQLEPGSFVLQYTDSEGDRMSVGSDAEYAEACHVFLTSNDAVKSLKFVAVTRSQAAFQDAVADPIVTSIEQLIAALSATLEHVKRDRWAAHAVGDALQTAAFEAASSPAAPLDHSSAKEPSARSAAEGFSSFAHGLVGQIKQLIPEKKEPVEHKMPAPAPASIAIPSPPVATPVAIAELPSPVAEVAAASVEVAPSAVPVGAPHADAPVVATGVPVAFSQAELKWADELSLVHNIFPNVSAARVIDMLEQCEGNVNVVLNTLMEDA